MGELDDEALRDRLDAALGNAEDTGRAVRTLDAMLGEPQVLIPVEEFGEILYAIIKEDTVVTVLPKGHGEEILQRGQALQTKVANGEVQMPARESTTERWDARRRWRREGQGPVVIERTRPTIVRAEAEAAPSAPSSASPAGLAHEAAPVVRSARPIEHAPTPERPRDPIAAALWDALERGSRLAAVRALHELLARKDRKDDLLPIWNEIAEMGIPNGLELGDLIDACVLTTKS